MSLVLSIVEVFAFHYIEIKMRILLIIAISLVSIQLQAQFAPEQELRAVWITTAFNIDWPSSTKISSEEQKAEFINLIEAHKRNGINAVFVQIRPSIHQVLYDAIKEIRN